MAKNPQEISNWAALGADVACLIIPGATGGGTAVRAANIADDVIDAGRAVKAADRAGDAAEAAAKAVSKADSASAVSGLCFVAGTKISTENGSTAIENIRAGDKVWSENPETGEKGLKEVVRTFVNETDQLVHIHVNGEEITSTPQHPFYVPKKGWTAARELRAGDILVLQSGEYVIIELVQHELLESPVRVYNFEVEDFHTYYAGNSSVLVHNACWNKGNLPNNGIKLSSTEALDLADSFLGKGYLELSPGRFVSSDGLRQVRMTDSDLSTINNHAGAPHLNFEIRIPNPLKEGKFKIVENSHIYIFD